jgi:hypothetical protein
LHFTKLKNSFRFWFVQVHMLFSIEERLTHLHYIGVVISWLILIEVYHSGHMCIRIVGRESIERLKSLIMSIRLLHIGSTLLKVEVNESLETLVNMINSEEDLRRLLRCHIAVGREVMSLNAGTSSVCIWPNRWPL